MSPDRRPWRRTHARGPDVPRERVIVRVAKNPGLAVLLSFLLCGLGQIYNGQILKGLLFMFVLAISIPLAAFGIGWLTGGAMWLAGLFDAYQTAQHMNQDAEAGAL